MPAAKKELLAEADKKIETIRKQYARGLITDNERYTATINVWEETTKEVAEAAETTEETVEAPEAEVAEDKAEDSEEA